VADWTIVGVHPGITLNVVVVTVTVVCVADRVPVTVVFFNPDVDVARKLCAAPRPSATLPFSDAAARALALAAAQEGARPCIMSAACIPRNIRANSAGSRMTISMLVDPRSVAPRGHQGEDWTRRREVT
jgi:hypothetical protein